MCARLRRSRTHARLAPVAPWGAPALANSPRTPTPIQVRVLNALSGRDSVEQKARLAFDACNVDEQGTIDREELFNICRQCYSVQYSII